MLRTDPLESLRCLVSGGRLEPMDQALLARLQRSIAEAQVVNRRGELVVGMPEAALVNAEAQIAYLYRDGIPLLIADEAIATGQFASS